MAWLSRQLKLEQKKPLVSGYIREQCDGKLEVPTDLIKVIRWFLDEVLYWSMHGKFLRKFCNKKVGQILYSSTYNYNEIEFCNYWYPSGNSTQYADQVIFGVTLTRLPKHIQSVTMYYRLQCRKFHCLWKSIHTFKQSNIGHNNCVGWNPHNLRLSRCKLAEQVDFNCFVSVIRVVYDEHDQIDLNVESVEELLQITRHQWVLGEQEMTQCQQCDVGKTFYSVNFGRSENWCLFMSPKGFNFEQNQAADAERGSKLMLYLRLLRLPINIKSLNINYVLRAHYAVKHSGVEYKIKEAQSVSVGYGFNECTKQCFVDEIPNITQLAALSFDVKIEIEEMVDMNGKMIPKQHWQKYGVVMNDNYTKIKSLSLKNWFV
mmetsp:Transcript_57224/g.95088  ORF Transcript_57224/g.95088 Transcript_57224/m.95088 type:complete len:374 (-) Transcript_57224:320-1441(-)